MLTKGDVIGQLTIKKVYLLGEKKISKYECECECGRTCFVDEDSLMSRKIVNCGSSLCQNSLIGKTFGKWKVIGHDPEKHRTNDICACECGTIRSVFRQSLKSGRSQSCGCNQITNESAKQRHLENAKRHIGERYGFLTILEPILEEKRQEYFYKCACDCGNEKLIRGADIFNGKIVTCGCDINTKARYEAMAKAHIGETYNKLTIKDIIKRGDRYWYKCECECGNQTEQKFYDLKSGKVKSCGCIKSSANREMELILKKYNISYQSEYIIKECRDIRPLPFDFAIFNRNHNLIGLIENNGEQHYHSGSGWNTPEHLAYIQKHDTIKKEYCKNNQIPFLIVPYRHFNKLEEFLISSEFWQIINKKFND